MSIREIIALSYLIFIAIGLLFFTVRSIVLDVRKNRRNTMPEYIADRENDNKSYDTPEPNRMSNTEIIKLHQCPNKKSAPKHNDDKNVFCFHTERIISKDRNCKQLRLSRTHIANPCSYA